MEHDEKVRKGSWELWVRYLDEKEEDVIPLAEIVEDAKERKWIAEDYLIKTGLKRGVKVLMKVMGEEVEVFSMPKLF